MMINGFIDNFEQIQQTSLTFLLLTLNSCLFAGDYNYAWIK